MFGDMSQLQEMFQGLQESSQKLQKELEAQSYSVKSGGGAIEIVANGKGEVVDLIIEDSLLEDKESLQILLIGAMNDLTKMIEQNRAKQAMNLLGGFNGFGAK